MSLTPTPKYIINLDVSPEKRWIPIIREYRDRILDVYQKMDKILNNVAGNTTGSLGLWLTRKTIDMFGTKPLYYHELESIAKELKLPVNKVILLQLCYECFSACTSIIIDDETKLKYPIHIRTMDWDDTFLRPLTINVKFVKNNQLIFEGTTWAGYVGILTGVKPNIGSVSVNYRRTKDGTIWKNIWNTLQFKFPVGYLVRECLTYTKSYVDLKDDLEKTILIAPCYIILTGVEHNTGVVIVRDRESYDTYNIHNGVICQTNIDPKDLSFDTKQNILMSVERHCIAHELCDSLLNTLPSNVDENVINPEGIIKHFLKYPILNHESIYANVMSPVGINSTNYINACWIVEPK